MKKLYFLIIKTIFFIIVVVLFSACSEDKRRLYYEAEGYGYVYYEDTKEVAPYAVIYVQPHFKWTQYLPAGNYQTDEERYFADATGFFNIKFLKSIEGHKVLSYSITASPFSVVGGATVGKVNKGYKADDIKKLKSNKLNMDSIFVTTRFF